MRQFQFELCKSQISSTIVSCLCGLVEPVAFISKLFSLLLSAVPHLNHAVVPPGVYDRRPPVGRRDAGTETSEEESKLRQVRACSKGPVIKKGGGGGGQSVKSPPPPPLKRGLNCSHNTLLRTSH